MFFYYYLITLFNDIKLLDEILTYQVDYINFFPIEVTDDGIVI